MNEYPTLCEQVGLDCRTCTETTAQELARCCRGITGGALRQLFVQIYTHAACARMYPHFASAYREAAPERMGPSRALTAVA